MRSARLGFASCSPPRSATVCVGTCVLIAIGVVAGDRTIASAADPPVNTHPATQPSATQPRIVLFQPGIRINWSQRHVETDVTVILRDAPIELFACAPKQREHEAIVRMEALPTHLYQAMGLVGLTPGKPMRVDEQGRFHSASGDFLDIDVRYPVDGRPRQVPIEAWMRRAEGNVPLGRLPWVFAGSIPLEQGRGLAADGEGTVVAVVDFPTSLIALPESHSDSNQELWLRPNTVRIPAIGSKAQMIIRAAPLRIRLESNGRLRLAGKTATRAELGRAVSARTTENIGLRLEITVDPGADPIEERSLVQLLRSLRVRDESITILRIPAGNDP